MVAGAALIALTLAARPQMVLAAMFGLVLFWPFLRDARGNAQARRACLGAFRAALVPFLVVAAAVMVYNFARFGSPLDFGANYNLTTNDMTPVSYTHLVALCVMCGLLFWLGNWVCGLSLIHI